MPDYRPPRAPLILISLVAACVFGYLAVGQWRLGKTVETWQAVDGRVTSREAQRTGRRRGRMATAWATHVEYMVDGKTYNGVFNDYEMGETMTVYFDPANPENATTIPGVDWLWFTGYSLAALGGLLGAAAGCALAVWPDLASG